MKYLLLCLSLVCVIGAHCPAGQDSSKPMAPETLLKSKLDTVLLILKESQFNEEEKSQRIMKLITPLFDFPLMGYLALGKPRMRSLNKEQRTQYNTLFVEHLKNSYHKKIMMYTDEIITYKPVTIKGTRATVPTELVTKDKPIAILYKLRQTKQIWKVYDVEVQGISLIKSYSAQFKEILRSGTMDDLFTALKKQPLEESAKP